MPSFGGRGGFGNGPGGPDRGNLNRSFTKLTDWINQHENTVNCFRERSGAGVSDCG